METFNSHGLNERILSDADSMKYCGVVTPFHGVCVYERSAMGMPGSETALKEVMYKVRVSFLPCPDDKLWNVSDGAVRRPDIAVKLYVMLKGNLAFAGFFSAKLHDHQLTWLPCEAEALAIAAVVKHFSPYIIQSTNKACVLTESKPCVQASPCVSTFSTASRCHVSI